MVFFCLGVNQNVIDENHNKLIHVFHKHLIHEIHEIRWGICKPEGHHGIPIESIPGRNALLGVSDSRILSLWYLNLQTILDKTLPPFIWSNRYSIWGKGYLFLMVTTLKKWYSTHIRWVPSFFSTNRTGAPHGDKLGRINPLACILAICFFSYTSSFIGILYGLLKIGDVLGNNSIMNSMSQWCGITGNSPGKTSGNSRTILISSRNVPLTWLSTLSGWLKLLPRTPKWCHLLR
jgi:hypothetical protein